MPQNWDVIIVSAKAWEYSLYKFRCLEIFMYEELDNDYSPYLRFGITQIFIPVKTSNNLELL